MKELIAIRYLACGDMFLYKEKTMVLHKVQPDMDRYIAVEECTEKPLREHVYLQTWLKGNVKVLPVNITQLCS